MTHPQTPLLAVSPGTPVPWSTVGSHQACPCPPSPGAHVGQLSAEPGPEDPLLASQSPPATAPARQALVLLRPGTTGPLQAWLGREACEQQRPRATETAWRVGSRGPSWHRKLRDLTVAAPTLPHQAHLCRVLPPEPRPPGPLRSPQQCPPPRPGSRPVLGGSSWVGSCPETRGGGGQRLPQRPPLLLCCWQRAALGGQRRLGGALGTNPSSTAAGGCSPRDAEAVGSGPRKWGGHSWPGARCPAVLSSCPPVLLAGRWCGGWGRPASGRPLSHGGLSAPQARASGDPLPAAPLTAPHPRQRSRTPREGPAPWLCPWTAPELKQGLGRPPPGQDDTQRGLPGP